LYQSIASIVEILSHPKITNGGVEDYPFKFRSKTWAKN
jgi:hypothetical protein